MNKGSLIILSGPSGVGKDTILKSLLNQNEKIKLSISATTRPKREYEENGKDYFFISEDKFLKIAQSGGMLEFANYCGNYYGTPKEFVDKSLDAGFDVILEIETEGALKVIENLDDVVSIFILPPSILTLKERLIKRGSDKLEIIEKRVEKAEIEIKRSAKYKYVVVNDDLDKCVEYINSIIKVERLLTQKDNTINEVLNVEKTVY